MKVFFDTEFIDDGKTIDLLSIGLVREDGKEYYAEPAEANHLRACDWVVKNVLPQLGGPVKSRAVIADEIKDFVGREPEFWAYFASYDWVAMCQLYGRMLDVPAGWPNYCHDLRQFAGDTFLIPLEHGHHALNDARWTLNTWKALTS